MKKTIIDRDLGREYRYLEESKVKELTHSAGVVIATDSGLRFVYCSGKTATNDEGATPEERDSIVGMGDIGEQTRQVCRNIRRVLQQAGADMDDIVRVRVFVVGPLTKEAFAQIHDARSEFFSREHYPASTLVVVSGLARSEALIEIDADAVVQA